MTILTIYILNWLNKRKLCSRPGNGSCRLVWAPFSVLYHTNWKSFYLLMSFLLLYFFILLSIGIKNKDKSSLKFWILPITFIIAIIYSLIKNGILNSIDIFGSTWCFMAVGFGIVSVLYM